MGVFILLGFQLLFEDKMAAKIFSSQNNSNFCKHDSVSSCNMHLTLCNMQKILLATPVQSEWRSF